ncbi:MAG: Cell division protein MraZ [Brockia lithotrophica]|uniref:Transcriptional regulator MraZ n=1 Tax=Brockia lithotrophica TaxID=933949 RepID=A0A2T5G8G1_9BACL|nr:division/cell wall cluster transcriptional repressor MraZ [Brockia lithotrophica]PTQ52470.1 MAG: Cell division protein MraZ [Brockia lithotrophica]
MFLGEHRHVLDEKGRLTIPARFREELGSPFILTRGLDGSLFAYPLSAWRTLERRLRSLPFTRRDVRAFTRLLFAGAVEVEPDRQGRISIPPNLAAYAGLAKNVVVVGVSARVEIWDEARWEAYVAEGEAKYTDLAESLIDLGLDEGWEESGADVP